MRESTQLHPVLRALRNPAEGDRLALVIEGGGMRGVITGGMALALHELGLADRFSAVYGSSAGTLNGMWLISERVRDGIPTWTDPTLNQKLINRRRLLGRRPVVDIEGLVERRYEQLSPGLFDSVLAASTELHPIATDVESGQAVDLHSQIRDQTSLRLAIRASSTLPLLAGPPVSLNGRRYLDAGLSAAIPFRAALADGATHLLVLRSRKTGDLATDPEGVAGRLTSRLLGRISPAIATGFVTRGRREGQDEEFLARHDREVGLSPSILSIRPAPDSAVPSRLERDVEIIGQGLEAGRDALREAITG